MSNDIAKRFFRCWLKKLKIYKPQQHWRFYARAEVDELMQRAYVAGFERGRQQ